MIWREGEGGKSKAGRVVREGTEKGHYQQRDGGSRSPTTRNKRRGESVKGLVMTQRESRARARSTAMAA